MKIKQELYFYIVVFISIITISSLVTYYLHTSNRFNTSDKGINTRTASGLFSGHDICVKAIHKSANGKVITLASDDRTAKYQSYNDSNQITFSAEVQPHDHTFLSKQRSTVYVSFRCTTSAKTGELLSLSQNVDDIHGIHQQ